MDASDFQRPSDMPHQSHCMGSGASRVQMDESLWTIVGTRVHGAANVPDSRVGEAANLKASSKRGGPSVSDAVGGLLRSTACNRVKFFFLSAFFPLLLFGIVPCQPWTCRCGFLDGYSARPEVIRPLLLSPQQRTLHPRADPHRGDEHRSTPGASEALLPGQASCGEPAALQILTPKLGTGGVSAKDLARGRIRGEMLGHWIIRPFLPSAPVSGTRWLQAALMRFPSNP